MALFKKKKKNKMKFPVKNREKNVTSKDTESVEVKDAVTVSDDIEIKINDIVPQEPAEINEGITLQADPPKEEFVMELPNGRMTKTYTDGVRVVKKTKKHDGYDNKDNFIVIDVTASEKGMKFWTNVIEHLSELYKSCIIYVYGDYQYYNPMFKTRINKILRTSVIQDLDIIKDTITHCKKFICTEESELMEFAIKNEVDFICFGSFGLAKYIDYKDRLGVLKNDVEYIDVGVLTKTGLITKLEMDDHWERMKDTY